ncbi:B3 domain-containing protein [Quillaja saponaria]|uniref:B3 domain-containing protein n=1 Tax=Quillaja saponaria TaxID=32244 RepID=A0AAD7KVM9_QUISA|nr:B3 domain-containing protein [Quillaja saponaria]
MLADVHVPKDANFMKEKDLNKMEEHRVGGFCKEEISMKEKAFQKPIIGDLSREEILLREKALKKPMTDQLIRVKKKEGIVGEKLMSSAIESLRNNTDKEVVGLKKSDGLKRKYRNRYNDEEWDLEERLKKQFKSLKGRFSRNLPEEFMSEISKWGGTEVTLVIQKPLFKTDLQRDHGRVSIPVKQIRERFLRDYEEEVLENQQEIDVQLIHRPERSGIPILRTTNIILRQWDMKKLSGKVSTTYVLRTTWNDVAKVNGLKPGDVIQIWSFRNREEKLCLALVVVGRGSDQKQKQKIPSSFLFSLQTENTQPRNRRSPSLLHPKPFLLLLRPPSLFHLGFFATEVAGRDSCWQGQLGSQLPDQQLCQASSANCLLDQGPSFIVCEKLIFILLLLRPPSLFHLGFFATDSYGRDSCGPDNCGQDSLEASYLTSSFAKHLLPNTYSG